MLFGIFFWLLISLLTRSFSIPHPLTVIIVLAGSVANGYYWDSKRENFFWRGFLAGVIIGPIFAFIIGYLIDRVSFRLTNDSSHYGFSELMMAAAEAKPDVIYNMVIGGEKITKKTATKRTILMIAAESNKYPQTCSLLIKAGLEIDYKDRRGMTALMWAAHSNINARVCEVLLEAGANANEQDKQGRTPLMHAALKNPNPQVVNVLLKGGANPRILDNHGKSVFDYAYKKPNKNLIDSEVYEKLRKVTLLTPNPDKSEPKK